MWLIMRVHKWESIELIPNLRLPFPVKLIAPDDGSIGYIEIFDDYNKALAAAQDGDLIVPVVEVKR